MRAIVYRNKYSIMQQSVEQNSLLVGHIKAIKAHWPAANSRIFSGLFVKTSLV